MQLYRGEGSLPSCERPLFLLYQMPRGGAAAPSTRLEVASNSAGVIYSDFAMIL